VITGNCNLKTFLIFLCYFVFTHIYLHFFSYSGEGFFILYKESKENRKVRNMRLIGNTDDPSILLKLIFFTKKFKHRKKAIFAH